MGTVYIVGAGASKFAGFPLASQLLPFLRQELEKKNESILKQRGKIFFQFLDDIQPYLPDKWRYDLEFILALLDRTQVGVKINPRYPEYLLKALDQTINASGIKYDPSITNSCKTLITSAFLDCCSTIKYQKLNSVSSLVDLDDEKIKDVVSAWTDRVQPGDCIITFNWDILNEIMLWNAEKWHYQSGYGQSSTQKDSPVLILKLHGSINWAVPNKHDDEPMVDYVSHFFDVTQDNMVGANPPPPGSTADYGESLIIPSYLKNPREVQLLTNIWEKAEDVLRYATNVIVLGYSIPSAYFHAHEMICRSLHQNNKLTYVKVVLKSDTEAFARWKSLCTKTGKYIQSIEGTFEDFITSNM